MESSEKIVLAFCFLLIIIMSTNLMLIPLLRGRRNSSDADAMQAAQGLMRRPQSKDAQAMQELARSVERFKREKEDARDDGAQGP